MKKEIPNLDELEHLIQVFNNKFPKGSRVMWRSVASEAAEYHPFTVQVSARIQNGMAVCWFIEKSGMVSIDPAFVDYEWNPDSDHGSEGRIQKMKARIRELRAAIRETGTKLEPFDLDRANESELLEEGIALRDQLQRIKARQQKEGGSKPKTEPAKVPEPPPITMKEMIEEVDREIQMRKRVYLKKSGGFLTAADDRRIDVMNAIREVLIENQGKK